MGVYMEVSARRLDGRVSSDRRLFLTQVLPPPDDLSPEETEELPKELLAAYRDDHDI